VPLGITRSIVLVVLVLSVGLSLRADAAMSTDELIQLKEAGLSESIIQLMVDSGYDDVNRVLRLKEAGFKDDTILSVIQSDLKESGTAPSSAAMPATPSASVPATASVAVPATETAGEIVDFSTGAKVRIVHFLIYRNNPVEQNSDAYEAATMTMVGGNTLKIEWSKEDGRTVGLLLKKPFKSPFYWNISSGDSFAPGKDQNTFVLKSSTNRVGQPETDGTHYWEISFEPANAEIVQWIERAHAAN